MSINGSSPMTPSHGETADANRIKVEEEKKPEERGYYLNPKLYGQPESRNIVNVVHANESQDNVLTQK